MADMCGHFEFDQDKNFQDASSYLARFTNYQQCQSEKWPTGGHFEFDRVETSSPETSHFVF